MSLRDKINSKLRPKQEQQQETMDSFDENSISILVEQGKSQLQKINLKCNWQKSSVNIRNPDLSCRWYNKTELDIKQIIGVQGNSYQPSFVDVGSIIHVQCIPLVTGIQYEGMPIIKEIGPIILDRQTQQEAQELISSKKATFFIQIWTQQSTKFQGLLKIVNNQLQLFKTAENNPLQKIIINENYPQIIVNRLNTKQLTIIFEKDKKFNILFADHKVRDVFLLLIKLIIGMQFLSQKQQQKNGQNNLNKQSTTDLINLGQLKKQIKILQFDKNQLEKKLKQDQNEKQYFLDKIRQGQQRLINLNKNYFQLQQKYNKIKNLQNSDRQELSFYKIQNQNIRLEKQTLSLRLKQMDEIIKEKDDQIKIYSQDNRQYSYQYLQIKLKQAQQNNKQIQRRYQYTLNQKQSLQEKYKQLEKDIENAISQKNYIQKKYESLIYQKSIAQSPLSPTKIYPSEKSIDNQCRISKLSQEQEMERNKEWERDRQLQLLKLKGQLKEVVEENNYLRGMCNKDKKSSSKNTLKLELFEAKKIVNRLTQTVSDKDMLLAEMRKINRELNQRIIQLNRINAIQFQNNSKNNDVQ